MKTFLHNKAPALLATAVVVCVAGCLFAFAAFGSFSPVVEELANDAALSAEQQDATNDTLSDEDAVATEGNDGSPGATQGQEKAQDRGDTSATDAASAEDPVATDATSDGATSDDAVGDSSSSGDAADAALSGAVAANADTAASAADAEGDDDGSGVATGTGSSDNTGNPSGISDAYGAASTESFDFSVLPRLPDTDNAVITVTLSIDSSRAHAYNSAWPSSMGTKTLTLPEGASVYDALAAMGVSLGGTASYVSAIDGLAEFACGQGSGWMYFVDGSFTDKACNRYLLSGGENITWIYTCDRGNDL